MPCYRPLDAWQKEDGSIVFAERGNILRSLTLPCGQCIGCRLERSRQWAVRCMHESQMHTHNSFVTLTYNDESLPADYSLNYRHFQLFMKRVRKAVGNCRFYMCGEYGETYSRPHYHACLFGLRPNDLYNWRKSGAGFQLYRSPSLEKLWDLGNVEVGDVTFESAAYVARYIVKKVTGPEAEDHYSIVDPITGEIHARPAEFTKMSLKPGIGFTWFQRYKSEVFPLDRVVVRGAECKPPRYYRDVAATEVSGIKDALKFDAVAHNRYLQYLEVAEDNTPARLAVKEAVTRARIKNLHRSIE